MDEMQFSKNALFVTLTYNNEHLPDKVNKEDVQLFFKRLRKRCEPLKKGKMKNKKYRPLRYFLTSEYGPLHDRPHYHAIIMDINPLNNDNPTFMDLYNIIDDSWQNGFVYVENAHIGKVHYVVDYMVKDAHLDLSDDKKETLFNLKSNGIGKKFIENEHNRHSLGSRNDFVIPCDSGKRRMPRYYKEKLFDEQRRRIISYQNRRIQDNLELLEAHAAGGYQKYILEKRQRQISAENEFKRKKRLRRLGVYVK